MTCKLNLPIFILWNYLKKGESTTFFTLCKKRTVIVSGSQADSVILIFLSLKKCYHDMPSAFSCFSLIKGAFCSAPHLLSLKDILQMCNHKFIDFAHRVMFKVLDTTHCFSIGGTGTFTLKRCCLGESIQDRPHKTVSVTLIRACCLKKGRKNIV